MSSHAVPRNMGKVEKLWKGVPDRYIIVAISCVFMVAALLIGFFYLNDVKLRVVIIFLFFLIVLAWIVLARSPRTLDKNTLFMLFFLKGVAGYNLLLKYSMTDNRINKLITIIKFMKDGTIIFRKGYGWLYAFDPDNVTKDGLEGFNTKSQVLLNSLQDDVFFKMEVRIEPKQDAQRLTERTNDIINTENDQAKLTHLKSIYEYSKEKEKNDIERKYYFFIGLSGKRNVDEAIIMKEKIEHGLQDKINNLNIVFSQIKSPYLLFSFYAGEMK